MAKFTVSEILMGRAVLTELPVDTQKNLHALADRLTRFFAKFSGPIKVTSGYRRPADNAALTNSAKNSKHLIGAAADLQCNGNVWAYCMDNLQLTQDLGLWLEDKRWTPTWVHLQIFPPLSGKRIFIPSVSPPLAPDAWNGIYDAKFNAKNNLA